MAEMELAREHYRMFYDFKDSLIREQCAEKLQSICGDQAPSHGTVSRWYSKFYRGRVSLSDEIREGDPATVVTDDDGKRGEKGRACSCRCHNGLHSMGASQPDSIGKEGTCRAKKC